MAGVTDGVDMNWIIDMDKTAAKHGPGDEDVFDFAVSDAALEAAANPGMAPALSFPNAPTVSILVYCCGDQSTGGPDEDR